MCVCFVCMSKSMSRIIFDVVTDITTVGLFSGFTSAVLPQIFFSVHAINKFSLPLLLLAHGKHCLQSSYTIFMRLQKLFRFFCCPVLYLFQMFCYQACSFTVYMYCPCLILHCLDLVLCQLIHSVLASLLLRCAVSDSVLSVLYSVMSSLLLRCAVSDSVLSVLHSVLFYSVLSGVLFPCSVLILFHYQVSVSFTILLVFIIAVFFLLHPATWSFKSFSTSESLNSLMWSSLMIKFKAWPVVFCFPCHRSFLSVCDGGGTMIISSQYSSLRGVGVRVYGISQLRRFKVYIIGVCLWTGSVCNQDKDVGKVTFHCGNVMTVVQFCSQGN